MRCLLVRKCQPFMTTIFWVRYGKQPLILVLEVFSNYNKDGITDDHVNVSTLGHVPTIDIIDYSSATQSGFGAYWHTHDDNMSIISKFTLNAVGKTVLQVVLNDEANVE